VVRFDGATGTPRWSRRLPGAVDHVDVLGDVVVCVHGRGTMSSMRGEDGAPVASLGLGGEPVPCGSWLATATDDSLRVVESGTLTWPAPWIALRGHAFLDGVARGGLWIGAGDGLARTEPDGSFTLWAHARGRVTLEVVGPAPDDVRGCGTTAVTFDPPLPATLDARFETVPCRRQ
jgi:hypothetical protein